METMQTHETIEVEGGVPIQAWTIGVPFDPNARKQLENLARLPIVHGHVAAMPDVHLGIGATVGSVIPTKHAIIPASVGVDIGCGMIAARTSLTAAELPDSLANLRAKIERAVPHGRSSFGNRHDRGAFGRPPAEQEVAWAQLAPGYEAIIARHPKLDRGAHVTQLGTLGSGNHFIELCLDEEQRVWVMLHSGSRGVGNRIGTFFIELAKNDMRQHLANLPDEDLAYLSEGSPNFASYVDAVDWAQRYAKANRELMMGQVIEALRRAGELPQFQARLEVVDCHHNYVARETHFGEELLVTRKGAVRAGLGELGLIPGSMGARSFVVRGKGNPQSFMSCSHGAGRAHSRGDARRRFTLEQHAEATKGVECRKDAGVLDETPAAYKSIEAVMHAQRDLVEVVHELRQVLCVKG